MNAAAAEGTKMISTGSYVSWVGGMVGVLQQGEGGNERTQPRTMPNAASVARTHSDQY